MPVGGWLLREKGNSLCEMMLQPGAIRCCHFCQRFRKQEEMCSRVWMSPQGLTHHKGTLKM